MKFSDMKPFVRYVRRLNITQNSVFDTVLPLDARIFYVIEGQGKISIENTVFEIPTGGLLFINSWTRYTILPADGCYLAVNFDFTCCAADNITPIPPVPVEKAENYTPVEHIIFEDLRAFDEYIFLGNCFSLEKALCELEREFNKKSPFYVMKSSAQLTGIIVEILRRQECAQSLDVRFNAEKIAAYIQSHLDENINNKALGEIFHFHPNYLSSEFCRYFGKPVHKYLLEQRVLRAAALLEEGNTSIEEIALSVGFSDANYFSRYFKKIMGISPCRYMKNKI